MSVVRFLKIVVAGGSVAASFSGVLGLLVTLIAMDIPGSDTISWTFAPAFIPAVGGIAGLLLGFVTACLDALGSPPHPGMVALALLSLLGVWLFASGKMTFVIEHTSVVLCWAAGLYAATRVLQALSVKPS